LKKFKRYRLRKEWNGIEVFDRLNGTVLYCSPDIPQEILEQSELLIDTPYPKTPDFASAPRRIYWELTRKCNLNCKSCFNRSSSSVDELPGYLLLQLARQFYNAGVYELRLTGGEPTMRKDFFPLINDLHDMGFYLSMGTNGVYSLETLEKVMKAPLDWIILSLDGKDEESNSEIRGPGNFRSVLHSLESLAGKACRLRVNTLIRKGNYSYHHLKGIAELCERLKIESLNCIPLRPVTNDPETLKLQLNRTEFRNFILGLDRLRKEHDLQFVTTLDLTPTSSADRIYFKNGSCAAGREGAVVSPYGEIYGCSYTVASDTTVTAEHRSRFLAGNLLENSFLEVWNQQEGWEIYRDLKKFKHENCQICKYYLERLCIGNCPIMNREDPSAFDPYCYMEILNLPEGNK
jgi:radical SAM protein with 4Fe4S-binding SPASM domain